MNSNFLFFAISCVVLLTGCDARQQLDAARAHRDAVIQEQVQNGTMSPAEAQDILSRDHAHDDAFDRSSAEQSYSYSTNAPAPAPSFVTTSQPSMPSQMPVDNSLMDSYQQESQRPNPYNGIGAQGYDGRTYIPAGSDPNPPPNVMR